MVLFKINFYLKIIFLIFFNFNIRVSQPLEKTFKNINLIFFQVKNTFKKQLKA